MTTLKIIWHSFPEQRKISAQIQNFDLSSWCTKISVRLWFCKQKKGLYTIQLINAVIVQFVWTMGKFLKGIRRVF